MEDAFLENGTLGIVVIVTCINPVLFTVVSELGHPDAVDSIPGVMIRDVPISAVRIGVYSAIEVYRAAQVVPLSTIIRVLEAKHVVDLGAGSPDLDPRLERGVEVS